MVATSILTLHSLPMLKDRAATNIRLLNLATLSFTTTAVYEPLRPPFVIENFAARESKLQAPFRACLRGWAKDVKESVSVSRTGHPMRCFDLMDKCGNYISCVAHDRHVEDATLQENADVILYFVTGRKGIGSAPGAVYVLNDGVIVRCSTAEPVVWKTSAVVL